MKSLCRALLVLALSCLSLTASASESDATRALPPLNVAALASAGERLYVASFDEGLWVVERDGSARRLRAPALEPHLNAAAWSEATHSLWLGGARGLTRCRVADALDCRRVGGASAVHALLLRPDGSLVAGGDSGLSFVRADVIRVFGKKQGAPFRSVWALAADGDRLFVGTTSGLFWGAPLDFAGGGRLDRASLVGGELPDDWVTALLSWDDRLLVGTYNAGLVSFSLAGARLRPVGSDDGAGYVNPAGLVALDASRVAIASMDGLRVGPLTQTRRVETRGSDVTAVARRSAGGYWVGTRAGLESHESLGP